MRPRGSSICRTLRVKLVKTETYILNLSLSTPGSGGDGLGSATPELEFGGQLAKEILGLAG